jgi:hypothetical protein
MNPKLRRWLLLLGIPVLYALVMWLLFDMHPFHDFAQVMSIGFLFGVPFGIGYLLIFFSPIRLVKDIRFRIFIPWVPVLLFLILTVVMRLEGIACWIMILPLFLIFTTLGGLLAGRHRLRRHYRQDKLRISLVVLLPFLIVPLEHLIPDSATRYEAYTHIDIHAPASRIWSNVVRVRTINEEEDHGRLTKLLGFPRPIRAELDYAGVGGSRQAIFSKGLIFRELVKEYADEQRMSFSIDADPHAIPATTMDQHIVVGGKYFDVLDGTYELKPLPGGIYRLNLFSHFTLKTRFNFYANWWAGWIMRDIQDNILQVIRGRCEGH